MLHIKFNFMIISWVDQKICNMLLEQVLKAATLLSHAHFSLFFVKFVHIYLTICFSMLMAKSSTTSFKSVRVAGLTLATSDMANDQKLKS